MQRLQFLSPSSSVEELLEEDEEEEEGNRLPSIDENCHVGADKVENGAVTGGSVGANDGNNNDVVHFKGWLNYAKLQLEASSKKGLKKNWNKGENEWRTIAFNETRRERATFHCASRKKNASVSYLCCSQVTPC